MSQGNNLEIPDINMKLRTEARAARQAASVAIHHLNYHHGSPHNVFQLHQLKKASLQVRL